MILLGIPFLKQVFDQHSEISTLIQKAEQKPNNFEPENEYEQLLADMKEKNEMNDLLDRYEILSQYDDEKSYSELTRYDIGLKCQRLEKFDYNTGSQKDLSDMAVQKYGFIKTKYRRKAWSRLVQSKREKNSTTEKQSFKHISNFRVNLLP